MNYKKKFIIVVIGFILVLVLAMMFFVGIMLYDKYKDFEKVGEFDLLEYEREIKKFARNKIVQEITDGKIAKQEAEKLWIEIYGEKVKEQRPYKVYYDKDEDIWLVEGTIKENLFFDVLGGVAYALMRTNGEVIAIWHTK